MKFKTYFKNLSPADRQILAEKARTSVGHLRNVSLGYAKLNTATCVLVEQATEGAMKRQDLRADYAAHWPELIANKKGTA